VHLFCVLDKGTIGSVKAHVKLQMRALLASPTKAEFAAIVKKAVRLATVITKDAVTQEDVHSQQVLRKHRLVPGRQG
jgi:hypothetical protein